MIEVRLTTTIDFTYKDTESDMIRGKSIDVTYIFSPAKEVEDLVRIVEGTRMTLTGTYFQTTVEGFPPSNVQDTQIGEATIDPVTVAGFLLTDMINSVPEWLTFSVLGVEVLWNPMVKIVQRNS